MTPYPLTTGAILREDMEALRAADALLAVLPERPPSFDDDTPRHLDEVWTCHVVARVFAALTVGWEVADGFFLRNGTEHAWAWRWTGRDRGVAVLDVLPVAAARPALVDGSRHSPWAQGYVHVPTAYPPAVVEAWERRTSATLALPDVRTLAESMGRRRTSPASDLDRGTLADGGKDLQISQTGRRGDAS